MKVFTTSLSRIVPFYRGRNSHFNMGNSSNKPYSPTYKFKKTDEVECVSVNKQGKQEKWWFFSTKNHPQDQDSIDYDSDYEDLDEGWRFSPKKNTPDYYYSEDEEDIELYEEICQILSAEGDNTSDPEWVFVCKNQD